MSGNYPDGLNQAEFDRYWGDKLDDDDTSPLDEPEDIDEELLAYWQSRSELFPVPDCFEIGHIVEGGVE